MDNVLPPPIRPSRMTLVDGLRAIAALVVILPHTAGLWAAGTSPGWIDRGMTWVSGYGTVGVDVFFVLSGFVIAYSLRSAVVTPRYFGNFLLRRSIRLDPPYWTAILAFLAYLAVQSALSHGTAPTVSVSGPKLLAHLFYVQDLLGYGDLNVVFWTLCIEVQFYLVFCLLLMLLRWNGPGAGGRSALVMGLFLAIYAGSLAWPLGLIHGERWGPWFLPFWHKFLIGALVWWTVAGRLRWPALAACLAALAVVAGVRPNPGTFVALGTATLLAVGGWRGGLHSWLNARWLLFLGSISYCIYLIHVPVAGVLLGLQTRIGPNSQAVAVGLFILTVLTSIGLATLMHLFIEVPSMRLSQRLKRRQDTPRPPLQIATPAEAQGSSAGSNRID